MESEPDAIATVEQLRELERAVFRIGGVLQLHFTVYLHRDELAEEQEPGLPLDQLLLRAIVRQQGVRRALASSFDEKVLPQWMFRRWMIEAEKALVRSNGVDWRNRLISMVNDRR